MIQDVSTTHTRIIDSAKNLFLALIGCSQSNIFAQMTTGPKAEGRGGFLSMSMSNLFSTFKNRFKKAPKCCTKIIIE